jgi:hypothetical protein
MGVHVSKEIDQEKEQEEQPLPVQELIPTIMAQMRAHEDHDEKFMDFEEPEDDDTYGVQGMFDGWDLPVGSANGTLLGELLLYYFEWMAAHKVADTSAQAVHGLLLLLLPTDHNFPNWRYLKNLLKKVHANNVVAVDICPNDCIAFYNARHPKFADYQHEHRTKCYKCNASRYLTDSTGKTVTAKVGYYFPMDDWMKSNCKDKDLDQYRDNDVGEFPSGHTRLSRGWYEKMTNNPHMNKEPRNQALIGMADGIPIFKDKNTRGVCPIALRQANQPDSLSKKFNNILLSGLYPCDYWTIDKHTKLLRRKNHKPSTICAMLVLLCDDLQFWYDGKPAVDYTMEKGHLARNYELRVILLFWCGDYPGLGEATNMVHAGYFSCHWCKIMGFYSLGRMIFARYRRYKPHAPSRASHMYIVFMTYL